MDEKQVPRRSPLVEIERQALAEGREWTRQRLQQLLQELAEKDGELSPPQRAAAEGDQTPAPQPEDHAVGEVQIKAAYGQDPASGDWLCPLRLRWGLSARQEMSPERQDRLCYTATRAGSYQAAAELADK